MSCASDSRSGMMKLDDPIQMSVRMRFAYDAIRVRNHTSGNITASGRKDLLPTRTVALCATERVVCRNFHRNIIDIYLHTARTSAPVPRAQHMILYARIIDHLHHKFSLRAR